MKQNNLLQIIPLLVILLGLVGYNYMNADWSAPTGAAPGNNTGTPLNVGSTTQSKSGNIALNTLAALVDVRSDNYCDSLGENCFTPTEVGANKGIDLGVIHVETMNSPILADGKCQSAGYDGVWMFSDSNGAEDVVCYSSDLITGINARRFVTAYYALRSDPSFATFWGSVLPNYDLQFCSNPVNSLYRCGTGWKVFDPGVSAASDPQRLATYNKICSYMMVNGSWFKGSNVPNFDSGSDNGNNALYWTGSGTGHISHDWNDYHDALELTCTGDSVTAQGQWWLKTNRSESYGRGGNKYPAPPAR